MPSKFIKKPPIRLMLEDYRLIEKLINEIEDEDCPLTMSERELRLKVQRIIFNIERAIAFNKEREKNQNGTSSNKL